MEYRIEHDSMEALVEADKYFGAQTAGSLSNFKIGTEKDPRGYKSIAYLGLDLCHNKPTAGFQKKRRI